MKQRTYDVNMHVSRMPNVQFTNKHYKPNQAKQPTLKAASPITLYELTHRVKSPSKTMLMNVYADIAEKRDALVNNHPSMEVARLEEVSSQVLPWAECMQWFNADGSLKSFRVLINGKTQWRTVAESADLIVFEHSSFDQRAHEYCISRYDDVTDLNEHETYLDALRDAYHVHSSLKRAKSELKDKLAEYDYTLSRYDAVSAEIHQLLS